jgi:hypothetical protein
VKSEDPFLFVIWEGGQNAEPSDRNDVLSEMMGYVTGLLADGEADGWLAVAPASEARTVRKRDDRAMVTDGPYTETKEVIGGYFVVEAASLDDAVRIAEGCRLRRRRGASDHADGVTPGLERRGPTDRPK